jgi:hypothetical protein
MTILLRRHCTLGQLVSWPVVLKKYVLVLYVVQSYDHKLDAGGMKFPVQIVDAISICEGIFLY